MAAKEIKTRNLASQSSVNRDVAIDAARRPSVAGTVSLGSALAGTLLATGMAQAAAEVPEGFVALPENLNVQSYRTLVDGTLELTLADGSIRIVEAGEYFIATDGAIFVAQDQVAALIALLEASEALSTSALVTGAGVLGAGVALSQGSSDESPDGGSNTAATIGGTTTGTVTEETSLTASGTLTVDDPDAGDEVFIAQSSFEATYGTFTLAADGEWTYTLDNTDPTVQGLNTGSTLTDSFTVTTADGTQQVVTVTINGTTENTAATIGGTTTGTVTEGDTSAVTGDLSLSDPDSGEDVFQAQATAAGTYGTFTLAVDGQWTYTLDNTNASVQGLTGTDTLADSFTAVSADGTQQVVTVTINAASEGIAPVYASALGQGGFVINGADERHWSGYSVSNAGDVNGDGFDDLIVGAPNANGRAGEAYVVFGKTDNVPVELSDVRLGNGGFVISGTSAGDRAGISVSDAGDVNGDGLDDLFVGAYGVNTYTGAGYVVFGKTDGDTVSASAIAQGDGGFMVLGNTNFNFLGNAVSSAGDVNGDGLDDLIVGVPITSPPESVGAAYVIFGKTGGETVNVSDLTAGNGGFAILANQDGGVGYNLGASVSAAGDVNGDGYADLLVSAHSDDEYVRDAGSSFVVFGKSDSTSVQTSALREGIGGFVIKGTTAGLEAGRSVSFAGDVNGDGFDDLIIGVAKAGPALQNFGAAYVVFGKSDTTAVELSSIAAGDGGFVITGASANAEVGARISNAGDINGDGFDDLLIGARNYNLGSYPYAGGAYVVFGKTDGSAINVTSIEAGNGGFMIVGNSGQFGFAVSAAGDVNGDGFDDLIIGAPFADPNVDNEGQSFVVLGGDFSGAVTQIGTVGNDTLNGTGENDVIYAGTGNDTISGLSGGDRASGGAGADIFQIVDGAGTIRIIDFAGSEGDQLDLSAFGVSDLATAASAENSHDTRITLDGDTFVILEGVALTDLVVSNVILS